MHCVLSDFPSKSVSKVLEPTDFLEGKFVMVFQYLYEALNFDISPQNYIMAEDSRSLTQKRIIEKDFAAICFVLACAFFMLHKSQFVWKNQVSHRVFILLEQKFSHRVHSK